MHKLPFIKIGIPTIFLLCIGLISYGFERYQSEYIVPLYFFSFIIYWILIQRKDLFSFEKLLLLGALVRVILLPSTPILSDDVYRFIWDGRLLAAGINPFSHVPSFFMDNANQAIPGLTNELFLLLNSQNTHTIYPPVVQFIFWLSANIFPDNIYGNIVFIRIFHFIAEFGVLYFLIKLLKNYKLPARNALLYFLNPLVVLELTGNIHAEGIMLLFILGGCYFYKKDEFIFAGVFFALSIATKLIPLIFLPYLLIVTPIKKNIALFGSLGFTVVLLFLPLLDMAFVAGMKSSMSLYFQKFEFNASIYYIVREIGFWVKGYNIIGTAGIALAIFSFLSIITISIVSSVKKWELFETLMLILFSYFLFTTILHPWYIIGILTLSIFTNYRYTVVWSGLIFLTYAGYTIDGYDENLWLVFIEYGVVIGLFIYELKRKRALILFRL